MDVWGCEVTPTRITIHCSDTPDGKRVTVDEIRKWHLARGWSDIGYHFVVYPDGTIASGRPADKQGAHVEGENAGNLGVCLNGRSKYTAEQFDALRVLLERLCDQYEIGTNEIYGHCEFESARRQGKTCPGIDMDALRRWFVSEDPTHETLSAYILEEEHA